MALVISLDPATITNGVVMKAAPFGFRKIVGKLRLAVTVINSID
jgi:hypothetical protein